MRLEPSSATTPEILIVTVTDIARGGAGVARDESGRVIFVPYTATGDRAKVRVVSTEKRYAQGELLEILEAGPGRVNARCAAFMKCGGCQWQHIDYSQQWRIKADGVRYALQRIQGALSDTGSSWTGPLAWDELPAERIWEYRNRVQLRGRGKEIGFFAAGSNELVPVDRCEIARPEILADWEGLRTEGLRRDRPYKVEVEVLPTGELRRTWNSGHAAAGFRQVHDEQNEKLIQWVFDRLQPRSSGGVLDLFGGAGNLSSRLAASGARVECVDLSSPAQPPAGTPSNLKFHRASVLSWLMRHAQSGAKAQQAIIDPPRDGLAKDLPEVAHCLELMGVQELIAVGCDADAWARDVSRFLKRGWTWQRAAILDFFPQTPHVESVAYLTRKMPNVLH